jgi:hypothetical protein
LGFDLEINGVGCAWTCGEVVSGSTYL